MFCNGYNIVIIVLQVDAAKVGLRATLLVKNNGKYLVNLDPLILCFLREAECLGRMGLDLPPEAIELQFMRSKIRSNYDSLTVSYSCAASYSLVYVLVCMVHYITAGYIAGQWLFQEVFIIFAS